MPGSFAGNISHPLASRGTFGSNQFMGLVYKTFYTHNSPKTFPTSATGFKAGKEKERPQLKFLCPCLDVWVDIWISEWTEHASRSSETCSVPRSPLANPDLQVARVEKEISCWPPPGNKIRDVSWEMCLVQAKTRKWVMTKKTLAEARSHCLPAFTMAAISCPKASPERRWAYNSAMPLKPHSSSHSILNAHLNCDSAHASAGAQRGKTSLFMRGRTAKLSGFGYLSLIVGPQVYDSQTTSAHSFHRWNLEIPAGNGCAQLMWIERTRWIHLHHMLQPPRMTWEMGSLVA